jgi:hypothetical protein
LWTALAVAVCALPFTVAAGPKKDTPAAAKTRRMLKEKMSVNYKETRLSDVAIDIQKQLDNKVSIKLDNDGGVSNNLTITYSADNKSLAVILDEMFAKNQLGYVVVSNPRDRRDGFIIIKKGKQRGYEASDESAGEKEAVKEKPAKDKTAKKKDDDDDDKPAKESRKPKASKDKLTKKDKSGDSAKGRKDKPAKQSEEDPDKNEKIAAAKLKLAKMLHKDKLIKKAKERYGDIIRQFPGTKAAEEARALLQKLEK